MDACAPADYHVHSWLCRHATGSLEEYIRSAIARGLPEMGFNEHFPMCYLPAHLPTETYAMSLAEFRTQYLAEIARLREVYADQVCLRVGAEVDYVAPTESLMRELMEGFDMDYWYGSVHILPGPAGYWAFDDDRYLHVYKDVDIDALYRAYFEAQVQAVASGAFDVLAHVDLLKKFKFFPSDPGIVAAGVADLARALRRHGVVVELNTAGWRKPVGEQYPSVAIVRQLVEAGVDFVLGSDSHHPDQVGYRFDDAMVILRDAGLTRLTRFERRRKTFVTL